FSVAAWTLSNGLVSMMADTSFGYIWGRLAFASASLIPISFFYFATVFPTRQAPPSRQLSIGFTIAASAAFLVSITPFIVRGTTTIDGNLKVQYGPLHLPFGLYFLSCLGFSLYVLIRKRSLLAGAQRLQVNYLFAAVLSAAIGATIANLIIPLLFGISE